MAINGYKQIMIVDTQANLPTLTTADNGQFAWAQDVQSTFQWNGTAWVPSSRVLVKKSIIQVNGKATGSTAVYTLEASPYNFYPTQVVFRAVNISGVTTQPTVSVGTNSTSYNNIVTAGLLNTLLSTLSAGSGAPQNASYSTPLPGGTVIYANVSIAAIATNYTFSVEILGFYDT